MRGAFAHALFHKEQVLPQREPAKTAQQSTWKIRKALSAVANFFMMAIGLAFLALVLWLAQFAANVR